MKRYILQTAALIAAFAIGLAISFYGRKSAEKAPLVDQELGNTILALRADISNLQEEIACLHSEIDSLNAAIVPEFVGDRNLPGGEKLIDGLYFNRNGHVSSRIKLIESQQTPTDHIYDEQGRLSAVCTAPVNGTSSVATYEYSGKVVTCTYNILYDKDIYPDKEPMSITTVYEYY